MYRKLLLVILVLIGGFFLVTSEVKALDYSSYEVTNALMMIVMEYLIKKL